jgi:uncharacterized OB-fold protein
MHCVNALPDFIIKRGQVMLYKGRMVSSMPKSAILFVKCVNCGVTFSINNAECMKDYRKTHKIDAMKKRILELNKRGKQ